jgi:MiaB/RimO family radical SAM methylthiotransferase
MKKKVYIHSTNHPCTENAMNLNMLRRWYSSNEWELTKNPEEADVLVMATCGFSKKEEDMEIDTISHLKKVKKEGAELIVTGCLPKINKERTQQVFTGKFVEITQLNKFDDIMKFDKKITSFTNNYVSEKEYNTDPQIHRYFKTRKMFEKYSFIPFVKVPKILYTIPSEKWFLVRCGMGCSGNCSYCAIKHAHGPARSEAPEKIIEDIKRGVSQGYKEISLTGEDQGCYGCDRDMDLSDLLTKILEIPGDFVVNLRYIDPYWLVRLKDKLIPLFQTGRIKTFCSPVQSGSNRILSLMNRRYTFEQVQNTVNEIMEKTKVKMISTNIIVGFPGETEEEFQETLRLITQVKFGMYVAFRYEDRPNTKASQLPEKVSSEVIERRFAQVQKAISKRHIRLVTWGV